MVLLVDDDALRMQWPKANVVDTELSDAILERPVQKLVILVENK